MASKLCLLVEEVGWRERKCRQAAYQVSALGGGGGSPALNQTPACLQLAFLGEDAERDVVDLLGTARPARLEWSVRDEDRRRLVGSGKALGTALREPGAMGWGAHRRAT